MQKVLSKIFNYKKYINVLVTLLIIKKKLLIKLMLKNKVIFFFNIYKLQTYKIE